MEKRELNRILKLHKKWMDGEENGERANLCGMRLQGVNLEGADLCGAHLRRANLDGACLRKANLERADLRQASLVFADLSEANLTDAVTKGANFAIASLDQAIFDGTIMPDGKVYDPRSHRLWKLVE